MYGYYDYEEETIEPKKTNLYNILIIFFCIIILFLLVFIVLKKNKNFDYSDYEAKLVKSAQKYFKNNYEISKEVYIDNSNLNVSLPTNCYNYSGVLYDGIDYKAFLICNDYKSTIIENSDSIKLVGDDVVILPLGINYYDLGYRSNSNVTISGEVLEKVGVYNINYFNEKNDISTRKVIIIKNDDLFDMYPSITLIGDEIISIQKGLNYVDAGVTAVDNVDGDISDLAILIDKPNLNDVGEYFFVYKVQNSRGYTNYVKRRVNVVENTNDIIVTKDFSTMNITSNDVSIYINIFGDNYSHTILPDNSETSSKMFEYKVKENGIYTFKIVRIDNNVKEEIVEVNNIDKKLPKLSCTADVYSNYADIKTKQEDDKIILWYNYYINNVPTGFMKANKYFYSGGNALNIEVEYKDTLDNVGKITCDVIKKDPTIGNMNIKYYMYNNDEYVVANTMNDLDAFEKRTCRKIAQVVDKANCGDSCLSFALYYAAYIQKGDVREMNQNNACNYNYGNVAKFKTMSMPTKQDALNFIYDEINRGKVMVLQVTGTSSRSSRHFYLIVGYRRSKYTKESLVEEDLLGIDSWTGCFSTISYTDTSKRTMFDNRDGLGYRIDAIKD